MKSIALTLSVQQVGERHRCTIARRGEQLASVTRPVERDAVKDAMRQASADVAHALATTATR